MEDPDFIFQELALFEHYSRGDVKRPLTTVNAQVNLLDRKVREAAGLSQEELANRLKTKKTAISRIENHAEDIKLSTFPFFL